MKCYPKPTLTEYENVAPHEGAWIEISFSSGGYFGYPVAPHEGAWIEILIVVLWPLNKPIVAPHEGAWIEIRLLRASSSVLPVAPHEGAWIEILQKVR